MKMKYAAVIAVTALAALVCASFEIPANAHGSGFRMHSFAFGKHFRPGRHKNSNQWWPSYGGLYAVPPYDTGSYVQPGPIVFVSEPPSALTCQTSKEIKTVPSESGGTRDITITRC